MPLDAGDHVQITPLGSKPGRILYAQTTSNRGVFLYLVRYEIGAGPTVQSVSSLYYDDELVKI